MNFINIIKMFLRILCDWPIGTITGVLILAVVLLFAWGCFVAIDSWFLPRNRGVGRIVEKVYTPAHTEHIPRYDAATKTIRPHPIFHPDDWAIRVELVGCRSSISIDEKEFDILKKGDTVIAEYVTSRMSTGLYLKSVSRV